MLVGVASQRVSSAVHPGLASALVFFSFLVFFSMGPSATATSTFVGIIGLSWHWIGREYRRGLMAAIRDEGLRAGIVQDSTGFLQIT